jgi:hypothetical protein
MKKELDKKINKIKKDLAKLHEDFKNETGLEIDRVYFELVSVCNLQNGKNLLNGVELNFKEK